jgi:hypothetical protein
VAQEFARDLHGAEHVATAARHPGEYGRALAYHTVYALFPMGMVTNG